MDDVSGGPIYPEQLSGLAGATHRVLVNFLRNISKDISEEKEEGKIAEILASGFSTEEFPDSTITNLTNAKAAELVSSMADTLEGSDPERGLISAALTKDNKLVAIIFYTDGRESEMLQMFLPITGLDDTVAGTIAKEMIVKNSLKDLARQKNSSVCWDVASFLCDLDLNETVEEKAGRFGETTN
jgi:hypothetical protein